MKSVLRAFFLLVLVGVVAGCGTAFKTGKSWDPKEARLFDDGIDVIADMSTLSGKWEYDMKNELDARTNLADTVAIVEVLAVQTNEDIDGVMSKNLDARIVDFVYGASPSREITLKSNQNSLGYALIARHEARLVGEHIVFLRWFDGEDGALANHFHISPASPELVKAVRQMTEARKEEEKIQGAAN